MDFVIAGGLGTLLHGSALLTRVVDVACRMELANLLRRHEAVAALHPVHRMTPQWLPFTRERLRERG